MGTKCIFLFTLYMLPQIVNLLNVWWFQENFFETHCRLANGWRRVIPVRKWPVLSWYRCSQDQMSSTFLLTTILNYCSWGCFLLLPWFGLLVGRKTPILYWPPSTKNLVQTDEGRLLLSSQLGRLWGKIWWERQRCGETIWKLGESSFTVPSFELNNRWIQWFWRLGWWVWIHEARIHPKYLGLKCWLYWYHQHQQRVWFF